jgi:hypothetical protein
MQLFLCEFCIHFHFLELCYELTLIQLSFHPNAALYIRRRTVRLINTHPSRLKILLKINSSDEDMLNQILNEVES